MRQNPLFNDQCPPPPQEVNHPPVQRERVGAWSNFGLDPNTVDITRAIVLPPLPPNTKFFISSGLLQMLQHRGLFSGLPSEDPHNHLHHVLFICKSMVGNQNLFMDVAGLQVFPLSLTGEATIWLSKLPYNSISTWADMQKAFSERYFPTSKKLKLKE